MAEVERLRLKMWFSKRFVEVFSSLLLLLLLFLVMLN